MGNVLDDNRLVTTWFRSGNEKGSRKKQAEGRRKIRGRSGILRLTTRLSYVYLTYMLRISYVIDSGKIGKNIES